MMVKDSVIKGMRLVFVDFLGLLVGILNGFFLPMVFSIEGYALFKTFSLYAVYAVVFSFGLSDGLYLMYGGKAEADIDESKTKAGYFFLIKLQAVVAVIMFAISYFIMKDTALVFFSFFIMPLQIIHFFRLYYRALGEFDKYSLLQGILVIFELLNTLFIVIYVKSQNPDLFITIKIINHVIVAVLFSLLFFNKHRTSGPAPLKWGDYTAVMKPGFLVLIADMAAALFFSLDRWFVMILFDDAAFAFYSFAVSILNLFLVFITSVTNIFYSYISKKLEDAAFIKLLKSCVLIISSLFPVGYFVLEKIVEVYLGKYIGSLEVLSILVLTMPFIGVINVLYINLYKASKSIKVYLKRMMVVLTLSFILNAVASIIFGTVASIAWATFASFVIWYFYSARDFKELKINIIEIAYLFFSTISFFAVKAADMGLLLSLLVLGIVLTINALVFYRKDIIHVFSILGNNVY